MLPTGNFVARGGEGFGDDCRNRPVVGAKAIEKIHHGEEALKIVVGGAGFNIGRAEIANELGRYTAASEDRDGKLVGDGEAFDGRGEDALGTGHVDQGAGMFEQPVGGATGAHEFGPFDGTAVIFGKGDGRVGATGQELIDHVASNDIGLQVAAVEVDEFRGSPGVVFGEQTDQAKECAEGGGDGIKMIEAKSAGRVDYGDEPGAGLHQSGGHFVGGGHGVIDDCHGVIEVVGTAQAAEKNDEVGRAGEFRAATF